MKARIDANQTVVDIKPGSTNAAKRLLATEGTEA